MLKLVGTLFFVALFGVVLFSSNSPSAQDAKKAPAKGAEAEKAREGASLGGAYRDRVVFQRGPVKIDDFTQLRNGDKIVKIGNTPVKSNPEMVAAYEKFFVGDKVKISAERNVGSKAKPELKIFTIEITARGLSRLYEKSSVGLPEGRQGRDYSKRNAMPSDGPGLLAREAMKEAGHEDDMRNVLDVFKKACAPAKGFYREKAIYHALNMPFEAEEDARRLGRHFLKDPLARNDSGRQYSDSISLYPVYSASMRKRQGERIDSNHKPASLDAAARKGASLEELVGQVLAPMAEADKRMDLAIENLSADEAIEAMAFAKSFAPFSGVGAASPAFETRWQALKKLNQGALAEFLLEASEVLALAHSTNLLLWDLAKAAASKDGIGKVQTTTIGDGDSAKTYRWIVGGKGNDSYAEALDLIIDLGGNDTYDLTKRGAEGFGVSTLIVDMAGNDTYKSKRGGIASGIFGASILIDFKGDDSYESEDLGQGFGLFGVGALIDLEGNDTYKMNIYGQGLGCVGLGFLYDGKGNDRYDAGSFAQGCGFSGGYGVLVDKDGDDVYTCTGKSPSPYGDKGEFAGFGQGCGIGFRGLAMGGIGVIADGDGKDIYRCGQFGLGIGYWYGMGIVYDQGGDDFYECSRYGLGTGAHYGVGVVLDEEGDDVYRATRRSAVAEMGSVWDLSVGVFVDSAGNDTYLAKSYAIGGASQNAIGIFWDKQGDDLYSANGKNGALGYIGDASYGAGRGAKNLSVFLDSEGKDTYTMPERGNGKSGINKEFGIWIDEAKKKD